MLARPTNPIPISIIVKGSGIGPTDISSMIEIGLDVALFTNVLCAPVIPQIRKIRIGKVSNVLLIGTPLGKQCQY